MVDSGTGRRYDTDNRVRAALRDAGRSAMRQAHIGRNVDRCRHPGVPARTTEADSVRSCMAVNGSRWH